MPSSSSSHVDPHEPVFIAGETCYCNQPVKLRESWRDGNPARRFVNCARSMVSHNACNFFRWVDPKLNKHYVDTLLREKRLASGSTAGKLQQELEKVETKLVKTESKLVHVKEKRKADKLAASARIGDLQMEVVLLRRILAVLFLLMGVVIGMIWYNK